MQFLRLGLFLLAPAVFRRASALPVSVSYAPAGTVRTYIPLIVVSISLFLVVFVFSAIKLLYVEQRRLATIHAPRGRSRSVPTTASFGIRQKRHVAYRYRPILVGFLGSPTWETNLASKLSGATWRRGGYHLSDSATIRSTRSGGSAPSKAQSSTLGSRLTTSSTLCCTDVPLTGSSQRPIIHDTHSSRTSAARTFSRYGDFGDFNGMRSPGGVLPRTVRRASPSSCSSIRLVNGPTLSNQVEYSFLSGLPPNAVAASPLMGTRDSFQLSRCSLKCQRKPAPSLPSLPSTLPFHVPNGFGPKTTEYLPSLCFSPLAGVAMLHGTPIDAESMEELLSLSSNWVVCETAPPHPGKTKTGLAVTESMPALDRRGSGIRSRSASESARKPLKPCLRRNSIAPTTPSFGSSSPVTPWMSETSAGMSRHLVRTPISDVDIGMLGLDRFRWNDEDARELKMRSCHMKKDSMALVPVWE